MAKNRILDAAKLFEILRTREAQSFTLERNAIPFLLRNDTGHVLKDVHQGEIRPGDMIVIQPSGEWHRTDPDLHAKDGNWGEYRFDPLDRQSVEAVQATTHAAMTRPDQIDAALSALPSSGITPIGWAPSISHTRAYRMPAQLKGARLQQTGQILDPAHQVLVMVVGDKPDCYANPHADMKDWKTRDRQQALSGDALIAHLPQLDASELAAAISWQQTVQKPLPAQGIKRA